jgi:hypothetical protein
MSDRINQGYQVVYTLEFAKNFGLRLVGAACPLV